ncbi:hypothetical protein F1737_04360 [Methanoplanus sp. FWC-SCC4]|uniref:Uncharacterized protein n=1 Tax=Methanochimaera problematica TaxID=2609417 RepID=A0AA97I2V2_9EURY|nr:hypothetical protein [Methanoplanus sp. FWC-SCC4]WOF15988.1 hypothetical protein F1737_04360 [Methanoplanus sp. FWC-SCC4]
MTDSENFNTTIYLRSDQAIIQQLYPQKFSQLVRYLADALIQGIELDKLPPEIAEEVVYVRRKSLMKMEYLKKQNLLKEDFFRFLDDQNFSVYHARYSKRKAKKIGKELAGKYREDGNILPECYVLPFLNEYLDLAEYSGKMVNAWIPIQENNMKGGKV